MDNKVLMFVGKSNLQFVVDELKDVVSHKDIVLKVVDDQIFNDMFSVKSNIEVDLEDDMFLDLAKIAHEKNITFNELVSQVLREQIAKLDDQD